MGKFGCVMVCDAKQFLTLAEYETHSCEIVSSKVNQPLLVISTFRTVISVFTVPVRHIFWMLQTF
jgi:hypothetical protein